MDQACREVMSNVEGAVACGIIELATQKLLGFHALRRSPALEEALIAAATTLLFRGDGRARPASNEPEAIEAHVASESGYHFAKVLEGGKTAVIVVASRVANTGMGSAQFRAVVPKVEPQGS
ncbi:MAG TPA: hypothetical protein VGK73_09755 [Polyangiaceae bacterium]